MDNRELRKELMMTETSIRTTVSEICNLLLNNKVEDEELIEAVLSSLVSCQKVVTECLETLRI